MEFADILREEAKKSSWHTLPDGNRILDNYLWLRKSNLNEQELANIRQKCNIQGGNHFITGKPTSIFDLHVETDLFIGCPPYLFGAPNPDKIVAHTGEDRKIDFGGQFVAWRSDYDQKGAIDQILNVLKTQGATQLCLDTGMGKTLVGLYVAHALGKKTLVVVHKRDNITTWKEKIEAFIPYCKVGEMRAKLRDTKDKDIVFATVQSLSKPGKYSQELLDEFGLVIADEVHLMAAETFHLAFVQIRCPLRLGLTATPERSDGLHFVIEGYFGRPSVEMRQPRKDIVVQVDHYKAGDQTPLWIGRGANKKPNLIAMVTRLNEDAWRNQLIIKKILERSKTSTGQILVVNERVKQVYYFEDLLRKSEPTRPQIDEEGIITSILPLSVAAITGEQNDAERTVGKKCDIIVATLKYAKESLDLPGLTAMFVTTPVSRKIIAQLRGRLLRISEAESKARGQNLLLNMFFDDWEEHGLFNGMFWGCHRYFKEQEYTINHSTFDAETMESLFPVTEANE